MGKKQELSPAEQLTNFLNFVDTCERAYLVACDEMNLEEKRLQDFLHEIELAPSAAERNKAAADCRKVVSGGRRIRIGHCFINKLWNSFRKKGTGRR